MIKNYIVFTFFFYFTLRIHIYYDIHDANECKIHNHIYYNEMYIRTKLKKKNPYIYNTHISYYMRI